MMVQLSVLLLVVVGCNCSVKEAQKAVTNKTVSEPQVLIPVPETKTPWIINLNRTMCNSKETVEKLFKDCDAKASNLTTTLKGNFSDTQSQRQCEAYTAFLECNHKFYKDCQATMKTYYSAIKAVLKKYYYNLRDANYTDPRNCSTKLDAIMGKFNPHESNVDPFIGIVAVFSIPIILSVWF